MRIALLALLAVLCTACGSTSAAPPAHPVPSGYRGFLLKPPAAAPDFLLRDQSGRRVGPQSLHGKWVVVTFLYTHCPDVCPLIAANLAAAQRSLPNLWVLAVSVDPKGDTPASVRRFVARHRLGSRFRYLTGARPELTPVWARYHVSATGGPETVEHSAFEMLIDPRGRERVLYDAQLHAADLLHDIPKLS